jgi:DNA mismatch repair protein MutL
MIRKLAPELIREIAVGEVIGAPVDVLKELLENALDAGATRLTVELDGGGIEKIAVSDNGVGIPKDELPLAAEAHSTSKLTSLTAICTLGFRGEGLYAIRYAARLSLTSRPAEQLGGATLVVQGDDLDITDHPAPAGTKAEVTHLFAYLPARRQGLGSPAQESKKVLALTGRYLLHHPQLSLKLRSDGEESLSYAGGGTLEAIKFLWGTVTANRLLSLEAGRDGMRLNGLLSRPELTRPRRDRLLLAVNGRPVTWPPELLRALQQAYRELLPGGHYPVGALNLELPAARLLVNTAPDKSRVRLLDEAEVAILLKESVEEMLAGHPLAVLAPESRPFEGMDSAPRHRFPALRHLGTYRGLYLLAEADGQLWIVDQHAAHERILFEELAQRYREEPPLELPSPELLPLTLEEAASYQEREAELAGFGLRLEPFGGGRWRLRTVPAFLTGRLELAAEVVKGALGYSSADEAWRKVLARLACLPAIKAGHRLAHADAQILLDALQACETPWACPHGRPTALVISELELARKFGRRGVRATEKIGV